MRKVEIAFVLAVLSFAVAFSVMSLLHTGKARAASADIRPVSFGAAGRARDVDIEKVKRLIHQGYLSDREAKFFREHPGSPRNGTEPPARPASPKPTKGRLRDGPAPRDP